MRNIADYRRGWPPEATYVGRGTAWGNPFHLGFHGDRAQVLEMFRAYATKRLARELQWLKPLKGRLLLCHCAPLACHASVLIELGA